MTPHTHPRRKTRALPGSARGGFTLIELLVVVAIIALLISILLPSLARAKDQARRVVTLSNQRNILVASQSFLNERKTGKEYRSDGTAKPAFPFEDRRNGVCSWSYGGRKTSDYWQSDSGGAFFFNANEKELNRYVINREPGWDEDLPIFRHPGDKSSYSRVYDKPNTQPEEISAYEDIGTSYQFNLHGLLTGGRRNLDIAKVVKAMDMMLRQTSGTFTSKYVWFMEDPMDYAVGDGHKIQVQGNFGEFSKFVIGYFDGHADYTEADTRYWCGPNWMVINPNWCDNEVNGKPAIRYPKRIQCDYPE